MNLPRWLKYGSVFAGIVFFLVFLEFLYLWLSPEAVLASRRTSLLGFIHYSVGYTFLSFVRLFPSPIHQYILVWNGNIAFALFLAISGLAGGFVLGLLVWCVVELVEHIRKK